jgi:hypothetical protein
MRSPLNLDRQAALDAQSIVAGWREEFSADAGVLENLLRRALGILQENGPFATVLYLLTRVKKDRKEGRRTNGASPEELAAAATLKGLLATASRLTGGDIAVPSQFWRPSECIEALRFVTSEVTASLDTLMLISNLWEHTLTYARYAASAIKSR